MKNSLFAIAFLFLPFLLGAQKDSLSKNYTLGGEYFMLYRVTDNSNEFSLKRAYLNFNVYPTGKLRIRFTPDVVQTNDGLALRMKYAYVMWKPGDFKFFKNMFVQAGISNRTWLSFEEQLNPYRVLGYMYLEKINVVNSADLGVRIGSSLGKKPEGNYRYKGGTYGDWTIGIYNGGGYASRENNKNKVVEGRLTLRPMGENFPNLLITTAGLYGKTSVSLLPVEASDFWYASTMLSYDSKAFVLSTQLIKGAGGYNEANYILSVPMPPIGYRGASVFYDLNLKNIHQFARFDYTEFENNSVSKILYLGGGYELSEIFFFVFGWEKDFSLNTNLYQIGARINF